MPPKSRRVPISCSLESINPVVAIPGRRWCVPLKIAVNYFFNPFADSMRRDLQTRLATAICLFAALCLYAPLTLSAWQATPSCCTGDHCAVPQQHHRTAASENDLACHHAMPAMTNCNMACCEDQDRAPITPVAYVLPPSITNSVALVITQQEQVTTPNEFSRSETPLSPPS
jgi:hypothetical protein